MKLEKRLKKVFKHIVEENLPKDLDIKVKYFDQEETVKEKNMIDKINSSINHILVPKRLKPITLHYGGSMVALYDYIFKDIYGEERINIYYMSLLDYFGDLHIKEFEEEQFAKGAYQFIIPNIKIIIEYAKVIHECSKNGYNILHDFIYKGKFIDFDNIVKARAISEIYNGKNTISMEETMEDIGDLFRKGELSHD